MSEDTAPPTAVETVIIGAGPVGLFQIFELGLLGIGAHIIDSPAQPGGQCTELYPDKPIYDIPALPICGAQELIDRLLEQAKPFNATFHLGQEVTELRRLESGRFLRTGGGVAGGEQPVKLVLGERTGEPAEQQMGAVRESDVVKRNAERELEDRGSGWTGVVEKGALDFAAAGGCVLGDDEETGVGI